LDDPKARTLLVIDERGWVDTNCIVCAAAAANLALSIHTELGFHTASPSTVA
jgi:hypothetical protein